MGFRPRLRFVIFVFFSGLVLTCLLSGLWVSGCWGLGYEDAKVMELR